MPRAELRLRSFRVPQRLAWRQVAPRSEDPLALRLRQATDPRLRRVLEAVAELSGWQGQPSGDGHGFGLAATVYHGTYCAEVKEGKQGD